MCWPPLAARRARTLDAPWGPISLNFNDTMSNAILVGRVKTETGAPIAVFGPQTSYYIPQLLVEKDVHGPGIDARGVAFAGTDIYVQLGRGRDYSWSATSASADNVDQFVLKLCEPGGGTPTRARWATCMTASASRSRPISTHRWRSPAQEGSLGDRT